MKMSATIIIKANTFKSKSKQSNGAAQNVAPIIRQQKYVFACVWFFFSFKICNKNPSSFRLDTTTLHVFLQERI